MTRLEAILKEAGALTPAERAELAALLAQEAEREAEAHEAGAGARGLAAWTESASDEDWSEFYPSTLQRS